MYQLNKIDADKKRQHTHLLKTGNNSVPVSTEGGALCNVTRARLLQKSYYAPVLILFNNQELD